jgi:hypothetical protein
MGWLFFLYALNVGHRRLGSAPEPGLRGKQALRSYVMSEMLYINLHLYQTMYFPFQAPSLLLVYIVTSIIHIC